MIKPFNPKGQTIAITADTTAPAGVQAPLYSKFEGQQVGHIRVVNAGATPVFIGYGKDAATATANAVTPTSGSPASGIPILSGEVEILRVPKDMYFSGISSATAIFYITPGDGE
jgi:hypothetical protein